MEWLSVAEYLFSNEESARLVAYDGDAMNEGCWGRVVLVGVTGSETEGRGDWQIELEIERQKAKRRG